MRPKKSSRGGRSRWGSKPNKRAYSSEEWVYSLVAMSRAQLPVWLSRWASARYVSLRRRASCSSALVGQNSPARSPAPIYDLHADGRSEQQVPPRGAYLIPEGV